MKKIFFIFIFLFVLIFSSCSKDNNKDIELKFDSGSLSSLNLSEKTLKSLQKKQDKEDEKQINAMKYMSKQDKRKLIKQRYSILKKRLSLRAIVKKGDYYLSHSQPRSALVKYLEVLKKDPTNDEVLKKIGDTYFELKNFKKALEFYLKVKHKDKIQKEKFDFAILAGTNLKDKKDRENILKIINLLEIPKEEKFYYKTSMTCLDSFLQCKDIFKKYFKTHRKFPHKLNNIKIAIDRYKAFRAGNNDVESPSIEQAYFIEAFYKNKTFPIVIIMGENLLKKYPGYRPIIKLLGISSYELGFYERAEEYLKKIFEQESDNAEIAYILGVVNLRDGDLISSNIYFSSAIKKGYKDVASIRRKIIFNYSKLGNKKGVLSEFDKLLTQDNITIDDITLAIYYNILAGNTTKALEYINLGIKKFPKDPVFYAYLGWIYREEGDLEKSREFLMKGFNMKSGSENPFILLNLGYLEEQEENYSKAIYYFAQTYSLNMNGEFGSLAKKERKLVEEALRLQNLEKEKQENTQN